MGRGLRVAGLIRVGVPLRRGQYSPDKGKLWAGKSSGIKTRNAHLAKWYSLLRVKIGWSKVRVV